MKQEHYIFHVTTKVSQNLNISLGKDGKNKQKYKMFPQDTELSPQITEIFNC